MVDTLGDDTPGLSTVQKWYAELKGEQNRSLEDEPRSGRPATATTPEIIDRVHQIVKSSQTSLFLTQLQLQQNELKLNTKNAQNKKKSLKLVTK